MLLLQRRPLCKLHKVEGQNTCDQIMSDRRFKHVQALNSMSLKHLNQHVCTKKRSDCCVPVWPGLYMGLSV